MLVDLISPLSDVSVSLSSAPLFLFLACLLAVSLSRSLSFLLAQPTPTTEPTRAFESRPKPHPNKNPKRNPKHVPPPNIPDPLPIFRWSLSLGGHLHPKAVSQPTNRPTGRIGQPQGHKVWVLWAPKPLMLCTCCVYASTYMYKYILFKSLSFRQYGRMRLG